MEGKHYTQLNLSANIRQKPELITSAMPVLVPAVAAAALAAVAHEPTRLHFFASKKWFQCLGYLKWRETGSTLSAADKIAVMFSRDISPTIMTRVHTLPSCHQNKK